MQRRLANFLHLFPGHTAMNVDEMAYEQWEPLAIVCDDHVDQLKKSRSGEPKRH